MRLRDYQHEVMSEAIQRFDAGENNIIIQSGTGTGKNFSMAYLCNEVSKRGGSALFTVAGRNVAQQFTSSLDMFKVPWTYVMSGEDFERHQKFWVTSIDTIHSWYFKAGHKLDIDSLIVPDYLLADEARLLCTKTRGDILDHFASKGCRVLGFDATPVSPRLHLVFDRMIHGKPTPWHMQQGNLSRVEHYSPAIADEQFMEELARLKVNGGEYSATEVADMVDKTVLIGEIVTNYQNISMSEYGDYKPFVVACANKKHAKNVEGAFLAAGHKVEYIDANTPLDERAGMFDRVQNNETLGIISVLTMAYGVDIPNLHIGINARPSKSLTLFLQFGGRILRTMDGKTHAVFIDHAGALKDHGYLDDVYTFSLDPDQKPVNETKEERLNNENEDSPEVDITCGNCMHTYMNSPICPKCGHENIINFEESNVVYVNTDLVKEHRESIKTEERFNCEQIDQMMFMMDMKAHIWGLDRLKTEGARNALFASVMKSKYKEDYNPKDLFDLPLGIDCDKSKRYMKHYNMKNYMGRNKGRKPKWIK